MRYMTVTANRYLCAIALFTSVFYFHAPAAAAEEDLRFGANDVAFLNLMGDLEGPRGFGTITDFAPLLPESALTEMTLQDVLAYQQRIRALGTVSSAVGRYQFIYPTLLQLVTEQGISGQLVFDSEIQTYLARYLMHDCGFYDRDTDLLALGNCLAGVWAALPLVSGPMRGRSAYADDGINRAFVTPDVVLDILAQRFDW